MKTTKQAHSMLRMVCAFLCLFCLCSFGAMQAFAADLPLVNDEAGLLTSDELATLQATAEAYSDKWNQDIAIYTTDSIGDQVIRDAADDYFAYNNFGRGDDAGGVVFVLDMGGRNYWFATFGQSINVLTDYGIEYIGDAMVSDLSGGYYADAFAIYLEEVDRFFAQAETGEPYDVSNEAEEANPLVALGIGAMIGIGAAGIYCYVGYSQLRTAVPQRAASQYVSGNGLNLTDQRDLYLYSNTSRRLKPQNNSSGGGSSTHVGSSGRQSGGGGGSF